MRIAGELPETSVRDALKIGREAANRAQPATEIDLWIDGDTFEYR